VHGGIGVTTRVLATELAKRGHQVRVVGIYPNNDDKPTYQDDGDAHIWRLKTPQHKFGWLTSRAQLFSTILKWVKKDELDLIAGSDYEAFAAGWPSLPIPVITRIDGTGSYNLIERELPVIKKYFWIEKASMKRSDFHCAVSAYAARAAERIYGLGNNSVTPIYNPMEDVTLPADVSRNKNIVVFAGTLVPRKGVIKLIEAWPNVLKECPDAELHIYGKDGVTQEGLPMKRFLLSKMDSMATKSVFFHGHISRDQLLQVLAQAGVGIFPSYSETFGNTPVEAMAVGCPTIYTKRSCGPEIITDGRDGLLVEPDNTEEISAAINRLIKNDKLAEKFEEAGRKKVREEYSADVIVPQNVAFFAECMERFRRGKNKKTRVED
jgi:glycosyltransferase involved in cell wall biosynthesis